MDEVSVGDIVIVDGIEHRVISKDCEGYLLLHRITYMWVPQENVARVEKQG